MTFTVQSILHPQPARFAERSKSSGNRRNIATVAAGMIRAKGSVIVKTKKEIKRWVTITIGLLVVTAFSSGCASIGARVDHRKSGLYPGVRNWPSMANDFGVVLGAVSWPFLLADPPLSIAVDTTVLPYDLCQPIK